MSEDGRRAVELINAGEGLAQLNVACVHCEGKVYTPATTCLEKGPDGHLCTRSHHSARHAHVACTGLEHWKERWK